MVMICKHKNKNIWNHASHGVLFLCGIAISMFIIANFSLLILSESFSQNITHAKGVLIGNENNNSLSADDMQKIIDLVNNGHVLTQDQFLSTITQFYNSIINILVLIISVLGIAAYFSIRASSKSHAEEISEKYAIHTINKKLEDAKFINETFENSKLFEEFSTSNTSHTEIIQKLQDRIASIEYSLIMNNTTMFPQNKPGE